MEIPKTSEKGGWNWVLLILILTERAVAWGAFSLNDPARGIFVWEKSFWIWWGLGLLIPTVLSLVFRHRAGGWLSALSSLTLLARCCIPLIGEKPAAGAVVALMVTSATMTFAFLYEQSYWPVSEDTPASERPGADDDEDV